MVTIFSFDHKIGENREYLIFFKKFFQKLEIILRPLLWPKNPNLKTIADLKVYCNLKGLDKR